MNTKEELRKECSRLFNCDSIYDCLDLLDIYSEFLFSAVINHHEETVHSHADTDAKIVAQMMFTKVLYLKDAVGGISYKAKNGATLNKIIDPTIVAPMIRNIYETVGLFNLIYRSTKTKDEKIILYYLWVHSGLKYRQRFASVLKSEENHKKLEAEKKQIEQFITIIEETDLYKKLDEKNQNKIKGRLKDKEYLMRFDNTEVVFLHWQELTKVMEIRNGLFDTIYNYFSLYTHPSNVAVFQFADMFNMGEKSFLQLTNFNLKDAFLLLSIFIADYINLFPNVLKSYNNLNIRDQIVINFYNTISRGQEYSINDSIKAVD